MVDRRRRLQLRDATRELHDATEAAVDVPATLRSPDDVDDYLIAWYRFVTEVEPVWQHLDPPLDRLAPILAADLRSRGRQLPAEPDPAPAMSDSAAAGAVYVVAGSRLGTASLSPAIAAIDPRPSAFLHPAKAGQDIQRISDWLERVITRGQEALRGAKWTFERAGAHLGAHRRGLGERGAT